MKITPQGFAVLDDCEDNELSRHCEKAGSLNHDPDIDRVFASFINKGDVVVDVGAAIGDHTVRYIRKTRNSELVHAFECNPLMYECLQYNCRGANLYPIALSDTAGSMFVHHNPDNAGASYADNNKSDVVAVCFPLDAFSLPKVDFIKMDIEGGELKAIIGARETIMRCRPIMILETHSGHMARAGHTAEDLFAELKRLNYTWSAAIGELRAPYNLELLCDPL